MGAIEVNQDSQPFKQSPVCPSSNIHCSLLSESHVSDIIHHHTSRKNYSQIWLSPSYHHIFCQTNLTTPLKAETGYSHLPQRAPDPMEVAKLNYLVK